MLALVVSFCMAPTVAAPAPGGTVIRNVAKATYVPAGFAQAETASSNGVVANVLPVEALVLTQDQSVNRPPATVVTLNHLLSNTGNVASSYTFTFSNNAGGCAADTLDLSGLRLVRDLNSNGVVDAADPVLPLGTNGALALQPGETASLLVQGTIPAAATGSACVALGATTALQNLGAINRDVVTVGDVAVIALAKSASHPGHVVPGRTRIDFALTGTNTGARDAVPGSTVAPAGAALLVNGTPTSLVLVRDLVPEGTQYVAGTLQSTAAGAVRLFRLPGDAPFSYRTSDDAAAVEVAVGLPTAVARNASVSMQFAVQVRAEQTGDIRNTAQGYYGDGAGPAMSPSNTVLIATSQGRIGVAKSASAPKINRGADGQLDGTATVRFSVQLRNYGAAWLYGVQAADLLEGAGATQFGSYTSAIVPGPNQYTVVPGSLRIVSDPGIGSNGTVAVVDSSFTGRPSSQNLLRPGAVLPTGAQMAVQFDVRVSLSGRTGTLFNSVRAQGALSAEDAPVTFDDSVDGADPDPDGDGNPGNNSAPTPVSMQLPALSLVKSASLPRRVGAGVYEIDYRLLVTNTGTGAAPNVRVIDNLDCTFDMDKPDGQVASWTLSAPPTTRGGLLDPAGSFTGRAACNRGALTSSDAFDLPTEAALSLTDGSRTLLPGQSEEIRFGVRITEKPAAIGTRLAVTNKAWAVALEQNAINLTPAMLVAASAHSVQSLLADPQGTVYNAVTREPVAGALVTVTRVACSAGPVAPLAAAEVFGASSGVYTFNADGSLSMSTGTDGSYQFFLQSPPATGLCTYALAVTPPAGSGNVFPSQLIPATPGTFAACSAVAPNAGPPQGADSTTHHLRVDAGFGTAGAACDVTHNHIPLDPGNRLGLVLRKDGSKRQAEFGDFVDYALTVTNRTGMPITGVTFDDSLPPGFAYVANSARLNGAVVANPAGGAGPKLVFRHPTLTLGVDQSAMVRYRVRIGVGAPTSGDAVNRARANSGPLQSNLANWTVRVTGGVFSDEAFLFGKVYMDCRRDGLQQGVDEIGIPGVRLYMEDGTHAITDIEGKWSLYGLKPITHALRVDPTTLPAGARLELLDHRNSGNPGSRFVDLKKGEFHKANFIVANCDDVGVAVDVAARRAAIAALPDVEAEAQVRQRLDPENSVVAVNRSVAQPASGQALVGGSMGIAATTSEPLIAMPMAASEASNFVGAAAGGLVGTLGSSAATAPATPTGSLFTALNGLPAAARTVREPRTAPALPQAVPAPIELETVLLRLADNALDFLDLKDGDTVPGTSINVRVKGPSGAALRLSVDGRVLDERRVGKKAQLPSKAVAAWEYIGVALQPGRNRLMLEAIDDFGNARGVARQITVVAPDRLGAIEIMLPDTARADLRTPVAVAVRLVDAAGVPVTARTQLTLEADRGRWLDEDLNPDEPGTQLFMDGGSATFRLMPPGEPGDVRIRVSAAGFARDARLSLLPEMRPMLAVGVVEGVLDLTRRGGVPLGAIPAGAAFESELTGLRDERDKSRAAGRAAFFLKGSVRGEYLLTAAYDSDKTRDDRLFRDIRPDEFYPVYGDSSVKGFDAQSTQKLYVRIDGNRSYLLYGDFTTSSSTEVRNLSQSNRSLTGLKHVYEDGDVRATSHVSRTAQTQQVEEFRAVGTSGPYYLSAAGGEFVDNSEQVEIVVRDRSQPDLVLQRTAVVRYVDYTIEPLTRRLLFTHAISSVDANLNPQSIRITYEVDDGGPKFTVAGTDVQVKLGERLQMGLVATADENPGNRRRLGALTAVARIGDNTSVAGEIVRTESDEKGDGHGARAELRHQSGALAVVALASRTSEGFDNPGASFSAGRTEAAARAEYRVDPATAVRGELLYSKSALLDGDRRSATASVQRKLGDTMVAELGIRHGQSNAAMDSGAGFDYGQISTYDGQLGSRMNARNVTALGSAAAAHADAESLTTVRARLSTQLPGLPQAQVFVEGEQDVRVSDRHALAIGGNYALTGRTRVYGRYELVSGLQVLDAAQSNNVGVLGVESSYMEGGRLYNEYRLADTLDGRAAQAAMGVRNTVRLTDRLRVTGGLEHTRQLGGYDNSVNSGNGYAAGLGESTAITSGIEYLGDRIKASGILEARRGDDSDTRLFSAGFGYRIDPSWSLLARSVVSDSEGQGSNAGNERHLQRHQIGVAYRPVDTDTWNALARYEHRSERVVGAGSTAGALSAGSVFGADYGNASLPGTTSADIVSAHVNYNPERGRVLTGRYAAKVSRADDGELSSRYWAHLLQARFTQDLGRDWDIGLQAGLLYGKGGALQRTAGVELGYQLARDLWISAGYNFVGLRDRDLTANEYTSKGVFLRLRFKFDEGGLGLASTGEASPWAAGHAAPPDRGDPPKP